MTADTLERLRQLASGAMYGVHRAARYQASNGHQDLGHTTPEMEDCPHPDCALVRPGGVPPIEDRCVVHAVSSRICQRGTFGCTIQHPTRPGGVPQPETPTPQSVILDQPPQSAIEAAISFSKLSPCRSKRGVAVFFDQQVRGGGYNYKPGGLCDGSEACKATCRDEAVHAEQQALLSLGRRANGCEMLHVKTVDGVLVPSGPPSCVQCSKLALAAGIAAVWLFRGEDGWVRYPTNVFHDLSLRARPGGVETPRNDQNSEGQASHRAGRIVDDPAHAVSDVGSTNETPQATVSQKNSRGSRGDAASLTAFPRR